MLHPYSLTSNIIGEDSINKLLLISMPTSHPSRFLDDFASVYCQRTDRTVVEMVMIPLVHKSVSCYNKRYQTPQDTASFGTDCLIS